MMKNQNDIQEIFKLIAEENAKIGNTEEKGVLIFGKTGAGKSTLTYYIAGEKLKAILDKGDIFLEEETPVNDIKINHTTKSETKIPGKYKVGNTAIIDLPGFGHTGGIVQEIANAFYIKRLFETTNHMKFILAIEETSLTRKDELINIIKQFAKTFTNIEPLKKSLSLFITKASDDTTDSDIKYALQQALDDNQDNEDMRPALNMLNLLIEQKQKDKLDIHFFPKPKSTDTTMCDNDLLNRIDSRTEYLDLSMHKDLANMPISARSKEWAQKLLEATYTNLKDLINIFTDTIKQADNPNNIFKDRYAEVIKPWLPTMSIKYEDLINPFKYFSNLEQIKELQKLFNDQKSAQDIFLDALKTFAKYTLNDDILKQQIQEYMHMCLTNG
ncbi:MAG TPA: GTPase domain-containing protein [Rickettsia endosymbiont of Ceroptres masudai]|nr:GTPase domain-containing protein [Rickettsia endosymbiont of Ceroptres masudai]